MKKYNRIKAYIGVFLMILYVQGNVVAYANNTESNCTEVQGCDSIVVEEGDLSINDELLSQAIEDGTCIWINVDENEDGHLKNFLSSLTKDPLALEGADNTDGDYVMIYKEYGNIEINFISIVEIDDKGDTKQSDSKISSKEVEYIIDDILGEEKDSESKELFSNGEEIHFQANMSNVEGGDIYRTEVYYRVYVKNQNEYIAEIKESIMVYRLSSTSNYKLDDYYAKVEVFPKGKRYVRQLYVEMNVVSSCIEIVDETFLKSNTVIKDTFGSSVTTSLDLADPLGGKSGMSFKISASTSYTYDSNGLDVANEFGHDRLRAWRFTPKSNVSGKEYTVLCGVRLINNKVNIRTAVSDFIKLTLSDGTTCSVSVTTSWK